MPFVAVLSLLAVLVASTSSAPLPTTPLPDVSTCAALSAPVTGQIVRDFAPVGSYGGHWGIDFGIPAGTGVSTASAGVVTFAGSVAEMLSVTVDHGGGLKTSYSYLSEIAVSEGAWLVSGSHIGISGEHYGLAAVHFSTRLNGEYQDPLRWLRCVWSPAAALRLSSAYPHGRATRHPRRDI